MSALLLVVILTAAPLLADVAQDEPETPAQQTLEAKQAEQAEKVLRQLAKSEYRAKVDIPKADCLFVEDGKIVEAMYQNAVREYPKAVPAGAVTKVSSVIVMEHVGVYTSPRRILSTYPGSYDILKKTFSRALSSSMVIWL